MSQLLEEILSRENMALAYKKVKTNKGASGIDGITISDTSMIHYDTVICTFLFDKTCTSLF